MQNVWPVDRLAGVTVFNGSVYVRRKVAGAAAAAAEPAGVAAS